MSNYYIGFDMNGTPYIEHFGTKKIGYRGKDTKYVAKVTNGGTTRYFYSNEEYQRYLADQNKQKVSAYGAYNRAVQRGEISNPGTVKTKSGKKHHSESLRNKNGSLTKTGEQYYSKIKQTGSIPSSKYVFKPDFNHTWDDKVEYGDKKKKNWK